MGISVPIPKEVGVFGWTPHPHPFTSAQAGKPRPLSQLWANTSSTLTSVFDHIWAQPPGSYLTHQCSSPKL